MIRLSQIQLIGIKNHIPFVSYKLPNDPEIHSLFGKVQPFSQEQAHSLLAHKKGFVMAPFQKSSSTPALFLKAEHHLKGQRFSVQKVQQLFGNRSRRPLQQNIPIPCTKSQYLDQIARVVHQIKDNKLQKMVLSRTVEGPTVNEPILHLIFHSLCKQQSNDFVYLMHLPEQGVWIGASPEPLLQWDQETVNTVALAGTLKNTTPTNPVIAWPAKEQEEQAMVSRYIYEVLKKQGLTNIDQHGPKTVYTASMAHLATRFRSTYQGDFRTIWTLLEALHPTPAICGTPLQAALDLIQQTEPHKREYYSGYLGPLGIHLQNHLFVNLRCMKVVGKRPLLYVGGGLTKDSIPENEWAETELKSQVLLQAIEQARSTYLKIKPICIKT